MNEWPIHPFSVIANEQILALPGNGIIYHATQYVQNTIHSLILSLLSVCRCVSVFILTYYGLMWHFREKYIFMNNLLIIVFSGSFKQEPELCSISTYYFKYRFCLYPLITRYCLELPLVKFYPPPLYYHKSPNVFCLVSMLDSWVSK